ncbi:diacylglycerol O-acyltransferase/trehalose O-mycolyltransferase [Williamsia limnetica]|uniref:Diacylglycerol O-acyltransferase/trehalose O-mycolyltransferase n=1 Tax=Williamsia limnetica TaxID=882452 RepID=A0A318RKC9_WILLI|nr:alpha/beta hydrolase family protein [Williamsia limnetica]PYE18478.1 diacylglycerol O-acyltransferase/trehalose O-mycolyltransferase [Williamsia limnetica]
MRVRTPFGRVGFGKRLVASVAALATIAGIGVVAGTGTASAWGTGTGFQQFRVDGCGMPGGVKVRSWSKPGNYKTVVMLDGLRATNDVSGWEHETNVQNMVDRGVNVVMPVGGAASFYSDWNAPSNFNGQTYTYKWNCVIANTLPQALYARNMVPSGKLAIAGISMGGNAALVVAANNKRYYSHAFSMSGYLNLSAPGMKSAIRVALLDADGGPWNSDSMWGPPWSTRWYDNDPFVQITKMHDLKVRVASGSGIPGGYNQNENLVSIVQGVPLETLSLAQTRAFEVQAFVNRVQLTTDYPFAGTHKWGYWQDMMWRALQQGWFR